MPLLAQPSQLESITLEEHYRSEEDDDLLIMDENELAAYVAPVLSVCTQS